MSNKGFETRFVNTVARLFHEAYIALAPDYGWKVQEGTLKTWDQLPLANKRLMVATVRIVIMQILQNAEPKEWNK